MSYMVARMQKMKSGNLGGAYKHNERVFENHSNKDIDTSRSHLNYELTERDRSVSYEKQIKDYVNENKVSGRAIRKDAVLCAEWIITSDKTFFENLDKEQIRAFFETAKNYFAENYGESNIAYASVHLDESTPHMHMGVVPFENGKLSSKAMFDRDELKFIQDDLPRYMRSHGFDLDRGELASDKKHKSVAEFKQDMADKELKAELIEKYGAPIFVDERTGEFSSDAAKFLEYQDFAETLGESLTIRETTNQEKLDWVRNHYREYLEKLESSYRAQKKRLYDFREEVDKKYQELSKIELRASESLTELSELKGQVKIRREELKDLENKSEHLTDHVESLRKLVREEGQNLSEKMKEWAKFSFYDLDKREEAKGLHDELLEKKPKLFGDSFSFSADFVNRLKQFLSEIVKRLEQAINQNEVLRENLFRQDKIIDKLKGQLSVVETDNKNLGDYIEFLESEKAFLDEIRDVVTEKEREVLDKRIERLREAEKVSKGRQEPEQFRGRSR